MKNDYVDLIKNKLERFDAYTKDMYNKMKSISNDPELKVFHWIDNENEYGILKDADALNMYLEIFLRGATEFQSPSISKDRLFESLKYIMNKIDSISKLDNNFYGFISDPYISLRRVGVDEKEKSTDLDAVDAAATYLNLIINTYLTVSTMRWEIEKNLNEKMKKIGKNILKFILESVIRDQRGARWSANKEKDYGDIFFTYSAAISLKNFLDLPMGIKSLIVTDTGELDQLEANIKGVLKDVLRWMPRQYRENINNFNLTDNEAIQQSNAFTLYYGWYTIFYLLDNNIVPADEITEFQRNNFEKFKRSLENLYNNNKKNLAALQQNFTHSFKIPNSNYASTYDDRTYISSFLSLISLVYRRYPRFISEDIRKFAFDLYKNTTDVNEWVDEGTGLWDDGNPLISFTKDALLGIIDYSKSGPGPKIISIEEAKLREAIEIALNDDRVIEIIWNKLKENFIGGF